MPQQQWLHGNNTSCINPDMFVFPVLKKSQPALCLYHAASVYMYMRDDWNTIGLGCLIWLSVLCKEIQGWAGNNALVRVNPREPCYCCLWEILTHVWLKGHRDCCRCHLLWHNLSLCFHMDIGMQKGYLRFLNTAV